MKQIDTRPYLERTNNATVFVDSDVRIFQALTLASSLRLYNKARILPTRRVTATGMLKLASQITGKPFRRGQYAEAANALTEYANILKCLPTNIPDIL